MSDYKLTIYADPEGPVGHFFVGVTGPGINVPISGKYMKEENKKSFLGSFKGTEGEVRDDSKRSLEPQVISRTVDLDKDQAEQAAKYLSDAKRYPGEYELFGKNCIDLAQGALDAAKVDKRIDRLFTDEELDHMGETSPYGAGDEAQRRGRIIELEENPPNWMSFPYAKGDEEAAVPANVGEQNLPTPSASEDQADPDTESPANPSETPKPQSSLPEADRDPETEALSPDVQRLQAAFMPRTDLPETRDDILLKRPHVLTADEVRDLHFAYWDAPSSSPERDNINDHLTAFYEHTYGTDPIPVDDTGKAYEPGPKQPIPVKPSPVAMKSGGTLADGLKRVTDTLVDKAERDGAAPTIQTLQRGLNAFGHRLRVDGDPGPKTQKAVRETLVKNSPAKIDEATALGAFDGFASDAKASPQKIAANDLDRVVRSRVEPLFNTSTGLNAAKNNNPKTPLMAGVALQRGLNDLVANDIEPLKEDGVVGPKTTDAFQMALVEHDTDELTGSFSNALGFS